MHSENESSHELSAPDLIIEADNWIEYKKRAEELVALGYKFDRNITKAEQDLHISAFHRDQQIDKVAISPAYANPNIAAGETNGEFMPEHVGVWFTMKE